MKTITLEQFMEFDPCYDKDKLLEIQGEKLEWSALDILKLDIPMQDRFWAVLREDLIEARVIHLFACDCAERALSRLEKPDERSVNAIKVKRLWLDGKATDDELYAARVADYDAYASHYAARVASYAARYVSHYAAHDVADCITRNAEQAWQLTHLIHMLEEGE